MLDTTSEGRSRHTGRHPWCSIPQSLAALARDLSKYPPDPTLLVPDDLLLWYGCMIVLLLSDSGRLALSAKDLGVGGAVP